MASRLSTVRRPPQNGSLRTSGSGQFALPGGVNRDRTFGSVLLNLLSFEIDVWGRVRRAKEAALAVLDLRERLVFKLAVLPACGPVRFLLYGVPDSERTPRIFKSGYIEENWTRQRRKDRSGRLRYQQPCVKTSKHG